MALITYGQYLARVRKTAYVSKRFCSLQITRSVSKAFAFSTNQEGNHIPTHRGGFDWIAYKNSGNFLQHHSLYGVETIKRPSVAYLSNPFGSHSAIIDLIFWPKIFKIACSNNLLFNSIMMIRAKQNFQIQVESNLHPMDSNHLWLGFVKVIFTVFFKKIQRIFVIKRVLPIAARKSRILNKAKLKKC